MNPIDYQADLHFIAAVLSERGETVSCAESCTGGLLAAAFTELPGSSAYFQRALVCYANEAKTELAGVLPSTIEHYGAVSEETVREMALGTLLHAKSHYALSISGIAGPDGGSDDKPVGTVWFALADKHEIQARRAHFQGSRSQVRQQAVAFALNWLAAHLGRR